MFSTLVLIHLTFARTQKGQKDFEKMIIGCSLIRSSTQSWTFFPSRSLLFMMIPWTNEKVLSKEWYRLKLQDRLISSLLIWRKRKCSNILWIIIESDFSWERIDFKWIVTSRKVFRDVKYTPLNYHSSYV